MARRCSNPECAGPEGGHRMGARFCGECGSPLVSEVTDMTGLGLSAEEAYDANIGPTRKERRFRYSLGKKI